MAEPDREGAVPAEDVAQLRAGQHERRHHERVRGDRELDALDGRVEVGDDLRDRHVHDAAVEHHHELGGGENRDRAARGRADPRSPRRPLPCRSWQGSAPGPGIPTDMPRAERRSGPLRLPVAGDRRVRGRAGRHRAERRPAGHRDRARRRHAGARLPRRRAGATIHAGRDRLRRRGGCRRDRPRDRRRDRRGRGSLGQRVAGGARAARRGDRPPARAPRALRRCGSRPCPGCSACTCSLGWRSDSSTGRSTTSAAIRSSRAATSASVAHCLYFSLTTLATVGLRRLRGPHQPGHTLAVSEALIGQIYLVTVVSLIVSNLRRPEHRAQPRAQDRPQP